MGEANAIIEEHWRTILLERLTKMETSMEGVGRELAEVKTSWAVAASDSKNRTDSMVRMGDDIKELTKVIRELEKRLSDPPRGQEELEKRVKQLEDWQNNLTGRLLVIGAGATTIIAVVASVVTAILVKAMGG